MYLSAPNYAGTATVIQKLKEATGIKIHGATVEMENIKQLSDFVCTACTSEFPCKDPESKKYTA
jgi:hypothetical protein